MSYIAPYEASYRAGYTPAGGAPDVGDFYVDSQTFQTTMTAGTSTLTVDLEDLTDHTQCVPLGLTYSLSNGAHTTREDSAFLDAEMIDNGGTVAIKLTRTTGTEQTLFINCHVVEFGSDIFVEQHAYSLVQTATNFSVASNFLDRNKTFCFGAHRSTGASINPRRLHTYTYVETDNTLKVQRIDGALDNSLYGHAWVIEDRSTNNSWFSVNHVYVGDLTGSGWINAATVATTDTDRTLILAGSKSTSLVSADMQELYMGWQLSSATQLQTYRTRDDLDQFARVMLVEFKHPDTSVVNITGQFTASQEYIDFTITQLSDSTKGICPVNQGMATSWHTDWHHDSFDRRIGASLVRAYTISTTTLRLRRDTAVATNPSRYGFQYIIFPGTTV